MVRINWTLQSIEDLKNIKEFISKDSLKYAKLQVLRLRQRVQVLKYQPIIGKPVPEMQRVDIRELIEGNYRIIYKIIDDENINILTVHHSARDLRKRRI